MEKVKKGKPRSAIEELSAISGKTLKMYRTHTNLLSRGWEIYDLQLEQDIVTQARVFLNNLSKLVFSEGVKEDKVLFSSFSNNVDESHTSGRRYKHDLDINGRDLLQQEWFKKFCTNINYFLKQKGRNCVLQELSLLKNDRLCPKQDNHRDYHLFNTHYLSGVVAFDNMSKTLFNIENKDEIRKDNSNTDQTQVIEIPIGHMLLFRGDCVHAGSAHYEENLHLYFHSYPEDHVLPSSEVQSVSTNISNKKRRKIICHRCKENTFQTYTQLYKHQRNECIFFTKQEKDILKIKHSTRNKKYQAKFRQNEKQKKKKSKEELLKVQN